ncbi:hypothetical protein CEUSTIGMA_g1070.t1 [Chlamydomonas eustigma]|uniref:Uncharacterized protein n=1 Tax=Chlamydomonas eustigma TaxID=1157962 RepID=A0A250WSE8_9CHLO|nr:hypothetical protein CEUSTIGMA_g1070.t1 [Chlamydomonas eustigma]|eukprot:GAX73619.1 hypothetical protein CEUSTIGMA_g1070.t1 [Chlamydomonas eustigma]
MSTFESIISDWDEGLIMKSGAKLAPLRVLEDTKLRDDYWRSGPTVIKSVLSYNSLMYMILRNKSDADEGGDMHP